jgi:hypothetical protein
MGGILFIFGTLVLVPSVITYLHVFGPVSVFANTLLLIAMIVSGAIAALGLFTMIKMYRDENAPMTPIAWSDSDGSQEKK